MNNENNALESNESISDESESVALPSKKQKSSLKRNEFKNKECRVLKYDKINKTLDVMFDSYGIRIFNVENFNGNTAMIKYHGKNWKFRF